MGCLQTAWGGYQTQNNTKSAYEHASGYQSKLSIKKKGCMCVYKVRINLQE